MNIFVKFLNFIKKYYTKIPIYLRGIFLFSLLILFTICVKQYEKYKFNQKVKNGYYVIISENFDIKDINSKNENNKIETSITESSVLNKKTKIIKGEVKQNSKSSAPSRRKKNKNLDILQLEQTDYSFGSRDAPVVIIEYGNYNCVHCVNYHNNVMKNLKEEFIDKGKVLYIKRLIMREDTLLATLLPYCINKEEDDENRFKLVESLYQNLNFWLNSKNSTNLKNIALKNGFTESEFNSCIKNAKLANTLLEKQNRDIKALNIFSTPTIFINGKRERGSVPYSDLKNKIEELLTKTKN